MYYLFDFLREPKLHSSKVIDVELNGHISKGFFANVSTRVYHITLENLDKSQPTPEWQETFGKDPDNLCFYTSYKKNILKVTPNSASFEHDVPRVHNVFINEELVAVIRIVYMDHFVVTLESVRD